MSIRRGLAPLRRRSADGLTLLELLVCVIVAGILATVAMVNYTHTVQQARNQDADSYLQALRRAAEAYHETWNAYPTTLTQVPQVFVPTPADQSSHWVYAFGGADATQWTTPTATSKDDGRQRQILANGAIQ